MLNEIKLYKEISIYMLKALKKEYYDEFDLLLLDRQRIIDRFIETNKIDKFEKLYNEYDIRSIDKELQHLLSKQIRQVKLEIRDHKMKMQGNSSYSNVKKENINIFSKKV